MKYPNGQAPAEPDDIRKEMQVYTHLILRIAKLRTDTSLELVAHKNENGLPIYDPKQEAVVIADTRRDAAEIGVDPDVAEEIVRILMKYSRNEQEKLRQQLAKAASEKGY